MDVPEGYRSRRRTDLEDDELKVVWIELHLRKKTILIRNMYHPPNAGLNSIDLLDSMLNRVISEGKEFILMGDLNCNLLKLHQSSVSDKLTMVAEEHNLIHLISEPTRITNHSQSLIDVIFTYSSEIFSSAGTSVFTSSDHMMVYGEFAESSPVHATVSRVRSFKQCNMDNLLSDLESAPWQIMELADDIDEKWESWEKLFFDVVDSHAPLKVRVKKDQVDWIVAELRSLMRSRNYYRREYHKSRSQDHWNKFKLLCREVNRRTRKAKADHYATNCQDLNKQPRHTWLQLNAALGRKRRKPVNSLSSGDGALTNTIDIVNRFVSHFSTLSATPNQAQAKPRHQISPSTATFKFSEIMEEQVLKKLSALDVGKATGPDQISARLLCMVAPKIAGCLTALFNASLMCGEFPSEWKCANVSPVPKASDKHDVNNYRPVSVIPVIAKVFESLVHDQLYQYLLKNKLLNIVQSGFRPHHCTQDFLLKTVDDWRVSLDEGKMVGTILIDLSKAFDMIDHSMLLNKLECLGVRSSAELQWFTDYLKERKQRVVMNGVSSEWHSVNRGSPKDQSLVHYYLLLLWMTCLMQSSIALSINTRMIQQSTSVT